MENPKCPYCGHAMQQLNTGNLYPDHVEYSYWCPKCRSGSPVKISPEAAYAAAMKRDRARGKWITKEYMYGDHSVGQEDMWIERLAEYGDQAYCSVCGEFALLDGGEECKLSNFCPDCGADMREEANDES